MFCDKIVMKWFVSYGAEDLYLHLYIWYLGFIYKDSLYAYQQ